MFRQASGSVPPHLGPAVGGETNMPSHDWALLPGWDGVLQVWDGGTPLLDQAATAGWLPGLHIGTTLMFAVGGPVKERPDAGFGATKLAQSGLPTVASLPTEGSGEAGDEPHEEVAVATLSGDTALRIENMTGSRRLLSWSHHETRTAARPVPPMAMPTSVLAPRVPSSAGRRDKWPARFSFADRIAQELQLEQPPCPAPFAVCYRVGEPAPSGGRRLAIWRRPLAVGSPLPVMRRPLSVHEWVTVDMEDTYRRRPGGYLD